MAEASTAKTAILGAGAWGTALAVTLGRSARPAVLCPRRRAHLSALAAERENRAYLPGVRLPDTVELDDHWEEAARAAGVVVMAVPSRWARAAMAPVAPALRPGQTVVSLTKGIEADSLSTMTEMLSELVGPGVHLAALSGPGFAAEIAREKPAALVAAARDEAVAHAVQEMFAVRPLRIYRSTDVRGVELCGAAKNVIAIAAGVSDGLELGSSARAAVITRGLAELKRLAVAAGARAETVSGLAGLGDLVLTCTGGLSRNHALGVRLGRDGPAAVAAAEPVPGRPVAEGVFNTRAIKRLADRHGVEMPLVSAVYRILYDGAPPSAMVEELLSRQLKAES